MNVLRSRFIRGDDRIREFGLGNNSGYSLDSFFLSLGPSAIEQHLGAVCATGAGMFTMTSPNDAQNLQIDPATVEDLDDLTELVMELLRLEDDFQPDRQKQEHGLKLILEQPNRGRIFVMRSEDKIVAMVNLLFTISTAEGGMVLLLEDFIVHPDHRRRGLGSRLLEHVVAFSKKRGFLRITLLTDRISQDSQDFFSRHGFVQSSMIPMRCVIPAEQP